MKKIKVGIIGPGHIAQTGHIPYYQDYGNDVFVTGLCGRNKEKTIEVANKFNIPSVYTDIDSFLKSEKPDIVSICTPNVFHKEAVIKSLNAGCNVLCEKPPAINFEESKEMTLKAKECEKILAYNFQYRQLNELREIKKRILEDYFGTIYHIKAKFLLRNGIPGWGYFTNKEMQGGGALIDLGVHMIDLVLYILGYPELKSCLASTYDHIGKKGGTGTRGNWNGENFTVEDACFAFLKFKNGCSLHLETAFALHREVDRTMNIEIFGSRAGAVLLPLQLFEDDHGQLKKICSESSEINLKQKSIHNIINAVKGQPAIVCTAEEGQKVQEVIDLIYKSARLDT